MCAPRRGRGLLELEGLSGDPQGFVLVTADVTDVAVNTVRVVEVFDPVGHRHDKFESCRPFLGVE